MKTIRLHPLSLALGALGAVLLLSLVGWTGPASARPAAERIEGIPAPRDFVTVQPKESFKVPDGKLFVAQGIVLVEGQAANNEILFDKETVFRLPSGGSSSLPGPGLVAQPGTKVEIKQKGSYLVGYLADE